MPPLRTAQNVVDAYNHFRQLAANSWQLVERVRDEIEVTYQQQVHDATADYNAALATLSAVHVLLDDARARLVSQHDTAQRQRNEQYTALLRSEESLRSAEDHARSILARTRLSSAHKQLIAADPPPALSFNLSVTPAALHAQEHALFVALSMFEEYAYGYTYHKQLLLRLGRGLIWLSYPLYFGVMWLWHSFYRSVMWLRQPIGQGLQRLWKPGWLAFVLAIIYITFFIWRDSFFSGTAWGIYEAFLIFDTIGFLIILAIIGLSALSLRRFGGSLVICFVSVSLLLSFAGWGVASVEIDSYAGSTRDVGSRTIDGHVYHLLGDHTANGHVYHLYGWYEEWYDDIGPLHQKREYQLYECDNAGFICDHVALDADQGHPKTNNLTVELDPARIGEYIVYYKGQNVMTLHDCGEYCTAASQTPANDG